MGCFQSKPAGLNDTRVERDLAYLSAFPNGTPKNSPERDPRKDLEDLGPPPRVADDSSSESSSSSSSDEELFPDSPEENRELTKNASFRHTHKLRVGVLEGTTFLNNYIVVDNLGRGSFGKVKLCLSVEDDSLYAVKVVDKRLIKQVAKSRQLTGRLAGPKAKSTPASSGLADIRREVEVMRALSHPNLVRLYEVIDDRESGKLLMVVEYCEAGALVRPGQLTPERRMPESIAQFYIRQMVSGLAYLHSHGVIHGDMKPENVLLSGDATVKIADFGQSQFMSEGEDRLRRTLGTPMFLAPEICAGDDYKGRPADIWALGISLYMFIYGELPFKGSSLLELYEDIADSAVPFPPNVPVSIELQDLLMRTLCKDPDARISADELLRHPWVREEDLITLMPSLFYGDEIMEGIGAGEGGLHSPHYLQALSGESPLMGSSPGSPPMPVDLTSRQSLFTESEGQRRMAAQVAAPTPEDVAAVVFPSLFSARPADDGAFSLGPAASIIGALLQAEHGGGRENTTMHPPGKIHLLANDSMVHSSLPEDTSSSNGEYDSDDQSTDGRSSRSGSPSEISVEEEHDLEAALRPPGEKKPEVEQSGPSAFSVMAQQAQQVQASMLAKRQQQQQQQQPQMGATGLGGGGGGALPLGGLETIEETSGIGMEEEEEEGSCGDSGAESASPSPMSEITDPEDNGGGADSILGGQVGTKSRRHRHRSRRPKLPDWLTGQGQGQTQTQTQTQVQTSGNAFDLSKLSPQQGDLGVSKSSHSQSLTFSDSSSLYTYMSSPFASDSLPSSSFSIPVPASSLPPAQNYYQQQVRKQFINNNNPPAEPAIAAAAEPPATTPEETAETSGAAAGIGADVDSGPGFELSLNNIIDSKNNEPTEPSSVVEEPSVTGEANDTAAHVGEAVIGPGDNDNKMEVSINKRVAFEDEHEEKEEKDKQSADAEGEDAAAGTSGPKNKIRTLLTRLSFKSNPSGLSTEEADAAAAGVPESAGPGPSSQVPRPPSAEPPLIQWCVFKPGQKLALYTGASSRNTIYYIESGTVELRWEASLPVPLTSVLSTMQNMPDQQRRSESPDIISTRQSMFLDNADSVALTMKTVANLAKFGQQGSNGSNDRTFDRSETLARTLQQATARAETLMLNATGGSIDNLLLSQRTASQFIGLLSMLDPEFFANRWRANAIAQSEVVAIRMSREGLDQFLGQDPLAQVHLRASMARGRAEIMKLESLERIADSFRRTRDPKSKPAVRKRSWKLADMGKAFGVTVVEATEVALGPSKKEEQQRPSTSSTGGQQETAGLEVFALVSRLRPGAEGNQ